MSEKRPCSPALLELLVDLVEEAAEVVQACTTLERFGPDDSDPRMEGGPTNLQALAFEYGQLLTVQECIDAIDPELLDDDWIQKGRWAKLDELRRYLKHSTLTVSEEGVSLCPK